MKKFTFKMQSKIQSILAVSTILILATFTFFRWSNNQLHERAEKSIRSLLKNESLIANTYALSKSVLDLEQLSLIKCSEVIESTEANSRQFYSTLGQSHCYNFWPLRFMSEFSFESKSINNQAYRITLQMNIPWQALILELLIYAFVIIGTVKLKRHLAKQAEIALMRNKALEIEKQDKQKLVDLTKQIRHDVQAPLTATRQILKMVKDIDPSLREILERSMDRTQELFNQLNASTNSAKLTKCSINNIARNIVGEKTVSWVGSGIELVFNTTLSDDQDLVMANEMEFSRLVSNLLNNGAEACANRPVKRVKLTIELGVDGKVEMAIVDSGKGMPQQVLDKLGQKGFTQGKEGHATAGSGLGVYHAITTIREWGGEFQISSREAIGTTMKIRLPRI